VTALVVPPIDAVVARNSLQVVDLPIERGSPHGDEELGCRVHELWYYW
jgi:hypothetical protein